MIKEIIEKIKTTELILDVTIATNSKNVEMAEKKFLGCRITIVDVEHNYGTTYAGIATVTLNQKMLDKYGITEENVDSLDINLYDIVYKEFIKNKKFTVDHVEVAKWDRY